MTAKSLPIWFRNKVTNILQFFSLRESVPSISTAVLHFICLGTCLGDFELTSVLSLSSEVFTSVFVSE